MEISSSLNLAIPNIIFAHLARIMVRPGPYNGQVIGEIGKYRIWIWNTLAL